MNSIITSPKFTGEFPDRGRCGNYVTVHKFNFGRMATQPHSKKRICYYYDGKLCFNYLINLLFSNRYLF